MPDEAFLNNNYVGFAIFVGIRVRAKLAPRLFAGGRGESVHKKRAGGDCSRPARCSPSFYWTRVPIAAAPPFDLAGIKHGTGPTFTKPMESAVWSPETDGAVVGVF